MSIHRRTNYVSRTVHLELCGPEGQIVAHAHVHGTPILPIWEEVVVIVTHGTAVVGEILLRHIHKYSSTEC